MRKYNIHSPFKHVVKTMRYKQAPYTAKAMFKTKELKRATINLVASKVQQECASLCGRMPSKSLFKLSKLKQLKQFDLNALNSELASRAPVLFTILKAAASKSPKQTPRRSMITMAAAVLLKARSQKMCMVQTLVSNILYSGHASKKVSKAYI